MHAIWLVSPDGQVTPAAVLVYWYCLVPATGPAVLTQETEPATGHWPGSLVDVTCVVIRRVPVLAVITCEHIPTPT